MLRLVFHPTKTHQQKTTNLKKINQKNLHQKKTFQPPTKNKIHQKSVAGFSQQKKEFQPTKKNESTKTKETKQLKQPLEDHSSASGCFQKQFKVRSQLLCSRYGHHGVQAALAGLVGLILGHRSVFLDETFLVWNLELWLESKNIEISNKHWNMLKLKKPVVFPSHSL